MKLNKHIFDQDQRQRALDPFHSFIVQAPAGSGKTELLTQRFLVLLSYVKQPEEILAITFTKKSAAEMRARIINALKNAHYQPEPEATHAKQTWLLAKNALSQNTKLNWNLLENPTRLRIQTIDSLNVSLTRQLPILSNFGAPPEIADDATGLYRAAIQELLSHLEEEVDWSAAIAQLLIHMDNDLNKVEELLINLLAKRDQWLPYITLNSHDPKLRSTLEKQLAAVVTDILAALKEKIPPTCVNELIILANYAGGNLQRDNCASISASCATLQDLPGCKATDKPLWLGLANLLITKDFNWRKKWDINLGFLPPSACKNPVEKLRLQDLQQRMKLLIEKLSQSEELLFLLKELVLSPDISYAENQWNTLSALHQVLRIAVAQLKLIFQQHGKIDYIENAQAALCALGNEEIPTDITLALDYKIQHILIDEFQDTSNSQYRLLEKLTSGWEENDGRTLFIVGDPMQSIYRFREADVGLFIRSRKTGIGQIKLEPLTLAVNFRSVPGVVEWVNENFKKIMPPFEDVTTGAVSYSASLAHNAEISNETVKLQPFFNSDSSTQANHIVKLIKEIRQQQPQDSIAILVRSRTHLEEIIPALKREQIPYRAIKIDPLTTRPVIQDLMALTKALLQPADRVAWLAILRAPWCGLTLADLLLIAGKDSNQLIWERIQDPETLKLLAPDSQKRLLRALKILQSKIHERRRYNLRLWIESTWVMLGGPACVEHSADLTDAAAFFALLEQLDEGGDLTTAYDLDFFVNDLFAATDHVVDNSVQIMTIHNAKGLEFDTVILPHLERKTPNDDKQLLLWMERSRKKNPTSLIIAPVHAIGVDTDTIYEYIKRQNAIKADYENGRLLYVAVTRAKKALHLLFNLNTRDRQLSPPLTTSLLEKMWDAIQAKIVLPQQEEEVVANEQSTTAKKIKRLLLNWQPPLQEIDSGNIPAYNQQNTELALPYNTARAVGIVIHKILQQLARFGSPWWYNSSAQKNYILVNLQQLGVLPADLSRAAQQVEKAIQNTLQHERGLWILQAHTEGMTELALSAVLENKIKQLVIDRTFIDNTGTRWLIDYKTSHYEGENLPDFLRGQQQEHASQLWEYYLALRELDQRPIKIGLYFPLIPAWHEWEF